jgi:subtilisin family serine protease
MINEYLEVKKALNKGIIVVAAAGNDKEEHDHQVYNVKLKYDYIGKNKKLVLKYEVVYINRKTLELTDMEQDGYYPAAYDARVVSVMSYSAKGKRHEYSNYGAAYSHKANGKDTLSLLPNNKYGKMSGTSMATPKKTGQIIKKWSVLSGGK